MPKPFTELSVFIRKSDHSSVLQFKYVSFSDVPFIVEDVAFVVSGLYAR